MDWSPDATSFYFIDTLKYSVVKYDYNSSGITNPTTLISFPQGDVLPDGMCVDADGGLWVAFWNGSCVERYEPNGKLSERIQLPVKNVTSCAFAGPNLETLIITTGSLTDEDNSKSGMTFMLQPGVSGQTFNLYPSPTR